MTVHYEFFANIRVSFVQRVAKNARVTRSCHERVTAFDHIMTIML